MEKIMSDIINVKIFSANGVRNVEDQVNSWLNSNKCEILDIKFQDNLSCDSKTIEHAKQSCLIIYKKI